MIRACVDALARLSRQEQISSDECKALGAPDECAADISRSITRQAVEALHADGVRTRQQLNEALREATDGEIKTLLNLVDEQMPNPFVWKSPTEPFCSCCDKRPDWWAGASNDDRIAKGYRWHQPTDPENGPGEWRYCGQPVICKACQTESDAEFDAWEAMDTHEPDPYHDSTEYERYCLEQSITYCLGNEDWAEPE